MKHKIKGTVNKVFFSNNTFLIVGIKDSNHQEHERFTFKGFSQRKPKVGDVVLISKGKFIETDYGLQLQNGSLLIVNEIQQGKAQLVDNEVVSKQATRPKARDPKKFELTKEQQDCIIAAQEKKDLKIKAYAGTGKTSTLVEVAKRINGKGLYLAYNKAIQIDAAQKFPATVDCKTAHSLAYGYFYSQIQGRLQTLTPLTILTHIEVHSTAGLQPYELAFLMIKVLRLFCNSNKKNIELSITNHPEFETYNNNESNQNLLEYITDKAKLYWDKVVEVNASVPIEHDFYLKMYQLSNPNLAKRYGYILFDECQDANPVIIDIILNQVCQKICVGDEHQQIYAWRGAVNSYDQFNGEAYHLSQSFRFGSQIAALASCILLLKKEKIRLKGCDDIQSRITQEKPKYHTHLSRTNAGLITRLIDNIKKKLYVVGGTSEVLELAKSGFALYKDNHNDVKHNKIRGFKNWASLTKFKDDFEDPDITFLVKMIDKYGDHFDEVIDQIENAKYVPEKDADIILSTIHKAKGREWDHVCIGDDFTLFKQEHSMMDLVKLYVEEFNLLYVGITRAKYKLHLEKGTKQFMHRVEEYVKPIIASLPAEETHTHPINVVDSIDDVFGDGIPF